MSGLRCEVRPSQGCRTSGRTACCAGHGGNFDPDLLNAFLWSGSVAKEGDGALRLRAEGVLRGVAAVRALTSSCRSVSP